MVSCPIPTIRLPPDELDALGEAAARGDGDAEALALAGVGALLWGIVLDGLCGCRRDDELLLEVFGDIVSDTTRAVRRYHRGRSRLSTYLGRTARKAMRKHRRRYMTGSGARPPDEGALNLDSRHFLPVASVTETTPDVAPVDLDQCIDTPAIAWRLAEIVAQLPDIEREVVRRRFGLFGSTPESLPAIGARLHLSGERIRQIEADALYRLGARTTRVSDPADRRRT